jgi:two-component SAPR family response regulator
MDNFMFCSAIAKLRPNKEYSVNGQDVTQIEWQDPKTKPITQEELDAAILEIQAERITEAETKATAKAALLKRMGLTADEAALLLA